MSARQRVMTAATGFWHFELVCGTLDAASLSRGALESATDGRVKTDR